MERCLRSECISDDVDLINNHVMGTSRKADSLFDARVIAFRNKVFSILFLFFSNRSTAFA